MDGMICVQKPEGWTSFDVVAKMRGIAQTKKVGHAGTLDPMATGVLPLFLGIATKACNVLPGEDKAYRANFRLGETTTTQDRTGEVETTCESAVTRAEIEAMLPQFTGEIDQIPPMYSAVQINGKRLYDLARAGQVVERKPRQFDATEENPYYRPETMIDAALHLRAAGAQFLRATGNATPAYTGALAAAVMGADVAPARFALGE